MRLIQDLTAIQAANAKLPLRTDSYTPITNREIIDLIQEEAYKNNLIIRGEKFISNNNMTQFIGQYFIESDNSDIGMQVAFKNSYDKTMPFQTAAGSVVFICSNSMISGEIMFKRKHTGNADFTAHDRIIETFAQLSEFFYDTVWQFDKMKQIELNLTEVAELTGRLLVEEEIINTMQTNIIKDELYNSKGFKHIDDAGFSVYDYYNHITESLKKSHPRTFIQNHIELNNFFKRNVL